MKRIFVGPSLHGITRAAIGAENLDFRPPAICTDVTNAVLDGVTVIGIIDGYFETVRSVWHKEILYALSDEFRALCGFRPVDETRTLLLPVSGDERIAPLLERLVDDSSLRATFEWLITRGDGVDELIAALVETSAIADDLAWDTVRRLADSYPGDPGIAISLLMHTAVLRLTTARNADTA